MKIYTKKGDDGSTGLLFGGRVRKDAPQIDLNGVVDEAQSFLGLARSECEPGSTLNRILLVLESDLWILMAEVATEKLNRSKLVEGKTAVSAEMVTGVENKIDEISGMFSLPKEFVVPGENRISAALDVARSVIRRAERLSVEFTLTYPESKVGRYLNRLSDLVWTLARWQEEVHLTAKSAHKPIK